MIVFDPLNHTYTEGGVNLPSVTTILKDEGFYNPRRFTPGSADRGTEIHLITQQLDEGEKTLKDFTVHKYYPYALAWETFKQDTGAEIHFCEVVVGGVQYGCAGTVDKLASIWSYEYIIDVKSGAEMAWHAIQTAGYKHLSHRPARRMCVYLKSNGKYKPVKHDDRYDETVWKAALISHRWKQEHPA